MFQTYPYLLQHPVTKKITDLSTDIVRAQAKLLELGLEATTVFVRDPAREWRKVTLANQDKHQYWLQTGTEVIGSELPA